MRKRLLSLLITLLACIQTSFVFAQNAAEISIADSVAEGKRVLIVYTKERSNERLREITSGFSSYHSGKKTHTRISSLYLNSNGTRDRDAMLDAFNVGAELGMPGSGSRRDNTAHGEYLCRAGYAGK